jgi:glutamine amidotransferase
MPDCMRELRDSGCARRCSDAARSKPLLGCASACRCCSTTARSGHAGPRACSRRGAPLPRGPAAARRQPLKVPHMGWNRVHQARRTRCGRASRRRGSTSCTATTPRRRTGAQCGRTDYGGRFTCAVARDNIFATQFHPEKSAAHGLALYRNFLSLESLNRAHPPRRSPCPPRAASPASPPPPDPLPCCIPAIDLKDGKCVRLQQGDMARATVFSEDPARWRGTGSSRARGGCTSST